MVSTLPYFGYMLVACILSFLFTGEKRTAFVTSRLQYLVPELQVASGEGTAVGEKRTAIYLAACVQIPAHFWSSLSIGLAA